MLNALVVVLRETLEASFLISLIFVCTHLIKTSRSWLKWTLLFAISVAYWLAENMIPISDWNNAMGQEVMFASILFQIGICVSILNVLVLLKFKGSGFPRTDISIVCLMIACVTGAVALEGSEIIIYFESAKHQTGGVYRATIGSFLGAGIGISLGIVSFQGIRFFRVNQIYIVHLFLGLVAAGMFVQSISYLSQAGIVESGMSIWDSSNLVSEASLIGQFLYSIFGYESTPTELQLKVYLSSISFTFISFLTISLWARRSKANDF